ncbi:dynactin subunit 3-like isoform X2 [Gigantopelta aegis]|uniref:dynactin subunit 3-like isoform X2 n=1 Tax=Gigantopelta aegis TaxID=1735272 RepID=UPI001B8873C9|nr:dynactin subunit 3-like isoform X2 [Gigantopelta aegis]
MAEITELDVLEGKIEALEAIVFGNADKDAQYPKCIDNMTSVQSNLFAVTAGKKKILRTFDKLPELEKYLDPAFVDDLTTPLSVKSEVILAEEGFLQKQAGYLDLMKSLEEYINSEHIRAVPTLSSKLHQLCELHIQQQDKAAELTEEVRSLLSNYNSIVNLLSKQFLQWDEVITRAEMEAGAKKS